MIVGVAIRGTMPGCHFSLKKPARHHDVIRMMVDNGAETPITGEQGFVTARGRFLNRREALEYAISMKQLIRRPHSTLLFSEDLW